MTVRDDVLKMYAEQIAGDPVLLAMVESAASGDSEGGVDISGPIEEVLQTLINTNAASFRALFDMTLRLADAVDELKDSRPET